MSMEKNLKEFLEELIQEVEKELDEATATGNVAGYNVPGAFSDGGRKDKKRKKKISTQFGMKIVGKMDEELNEAISRSYYLEKYGANDEFSGKKVATYSKFDKNKIKSDFNRFAKTLKDEEELHFMGVNTDKKRSGDDYLFSVVNQDGKNRIEITKGSRTFYKPFKSFKLESVNESIITEKQLKGLDGIDDKTPLSKISDKQKLKIIQGTGNIISFKVPKGSDRNFWQVISKGKIKKTRNLQGYVRYILPGKMISSPFFKSEKDLVNGVDWDSVEKARRFNESVNEATFRPNSGTMSGGTYGLDKRKYELKRDVKGVQIGDYTNVTLPKGTIIYNLSGGVFAHHRSLKSYEAGMNKYFNKPTFRGISIRREKNVILSIEKNSKILESVNEAKVKRPVNRWLELKNDETKHPHKKMAMGLKELKYQLRETEKFFNWYGKIKSMNELDSSDYWKRTNKHIYKIKERLINIARTIQEIEK
jgi:hypothetical protein